jgi:MoaA/NifB/PqqE/SkfB family radical SAM enzyme
MLPKNNYNGYYCPAIWQQVHLSTKGEILPCCVYKNDKTPEYIKDGNTELHNSDIFVKDRQTILDKKIPKGCSYCVKQEAQNIKSHREHLIEKLTPMDHKENLKVGNDSIEYLDVRLGNTCNFMCNFCGPESSHLLAKEYLQNGLENEIDKAHSYQFDDKAVFQKFINTINKYPNLKFVHIAGGEPFFMKKELLMLLNAINNKSKVTVRILTNVSVYDTDIIEKLKEFQKVNLMLSIDAVGRHIEISRWKSNWKVLETNIQRFKKDNFNLIMVPAISLYTVSSLPDLLEYCTMNEIYSDILFIQDPVHQVVNMIPANNLKIIKEEIIQKYLGNLISEKYVNYKEIIQQLNFYIEKNHVKEETIKAFWKWQDYFEKNRNYSLKKELPHVYDAIKK